MLIFIIDEYIYAYNIKSEEYREVQSRETLYKPKITMLILVYTIIRYYAYNSIYYYLYPYMNN